MRSLRRGRWGPTLVAAGHSLALPVTGYTVDVLAQVLGLRGPAAADEPSAAHENRTLGLLDFELAMKLPEL